MSICNNGDSHGRWDMDAGTPNVNGKKHKSVKEEKTILKMRNYEVIHRVMVEAESPVDAAYGSLLLVQNGESHALCYEVKLGNKRKATVDLSTDPPTVI